MARSVYSGKDAAIDGIPCVTSWGLSQAVAAARYFASCLGDGSNTPAGTINWTGQAAGVGATSELFPTGLSVDFLGCVNNDAGQGDLLSYAAEILPEQLTIDFNKATGEPARWASTFGLNGEPVAEVSGVTDDTLNDVVASSLLQIFVNGADIESDEVALQTAQIVIKRTPSTFARDGFTYRRPGNLTADISFALSSPSLDITAFEANAIEQVKFVLGSNQTTDPHWLFEKIRFLGKSNFTVGRGDPPPITGYTVSGQWNAVDDGERGILAYFDGSDWTDYYGSTASS